MLNFKKFFTYSMLIPIALTSSCSKNNQNTLSFYGFGTVINIKYYGVLNEEIIKSLSSLIDNYDNAFDAHSKDGLIYKINDNPNVDIDAGLIQEIMSQALVYKLETSNVFNPFLKNVIDLWKTSISNKVLPDEQTITDLNTKSLSTSIQFNNGNAKLIGEGKIDLGGIAKGYLLHKLKPYFKGNDIRDFIIDAGSSSIMLGESSTNKEDGTYNVGIYKSSESSPSKYIKQKNISIGTSSIYEQGYLKINNKTYSHCVNGQNGCAEALNDMVIVLGEDPIMCDVYSTVGMVSTIDQIKAIELVKPLKFLVFSDDKIIYQNQDIEVYTR